MSTTYKTIGIMSRRQTEGVRETLNSLYKLLKAKGFALLIEDETAAMIADCKSEVIAAEQLGKATQVVVVVGGDGSLLQAAHYLVDDGTPVFGINRGRLGFLTDILPDELEKKVIEVLAGQYVEESRFLFTAEVVGETPSQADALNDIVFSTGSVGRMVEFELFVNQQFVYSQRSDGLIISTPTGSTAYSLSGGGPIVQPGLNAMILVPMCPHTLTSRPIVIDSNSEIALTVTTQTDIHPVVNVDGQTIWTLTPGQTLKIKQKSKRLRLLHPKDYNYFHVLRNKLHWGRKLTDLHPDN